MKNRNSIFHRQPEVIVGGIIESLDHQILLTLQPRWGRERYLAFVAGHLKFRESFEQALKREIKEEVGLEIIRYEPISPGELPQPSNSIYAEHHLVFINYLCKANYLSKEAYIPLKLGPEIEKVRWVLPEEAANLVIEEHALLIQRLLNEGRLGQPSNKLPALR